MNLSCGCLIFCYTPPSPYFSLLFSATCLHCTTLTEVRYITEVRSGFLLAMVSSFISYTLFFLSIIINYLFMYWRGREVCFCAVSYAASQRRTFLDGCLVLPFTRITTIGLLVLFISNLICAHVSSAIWLMPFEYFWIEATYACIFFIMLVGLRGSRWVLYKPSLMMLPADTLKASHASTKSEVMWEVKNI